MDCCKFFISDSGNCLVKSISGDCLINGFHELKAEMNEGAGEKHLPVVKVENNIIKIDVGSVSHPMTNEHLIEWVSVKTEKGEQLVRLNPDGAPTAEFALLPDDKLKCVYAYCNQHGLWKIEF